MKDDLDAIQGRLERVVISHITPDEFGVWVGVIGCAARWVYLGIEAVEYAHRMAAPNELVDQIRSDKTHSACYEDLFGSHEARLSQ